MPKIEFEISGLAALKGKLSTTPARLRKNVSKALYQFGEEVMEASKRIVPVDTGALMNTGQVSLPSQSGNEVSVTVGYGDESVDYALYVHENLNAVNWTRPGSGPKYLENPLKERQDQLPGRIKDAILKSFK